MSKIIFLPMNESHEAQAGESLLDVALREGVPMQHACGGFCACSTCHVIIKSGSENLSPIEEDEEERLDGATGLTLHSRLGCQAKVRGDVTVEIVNLET